MWLNAIWISLLVVFSMEYTSSSTDRNEPRLWPSQWGVPLIPEWIPSRRQCTSLRRLLITLMFVIVMLCPILFNGKRWVRNDHNRKHTPLNVLNPLTDFEKPLTETIYLTCSIIWCHQLNQKVRYEKVEKYEKSRQKLSMTSTFLSPQFSYRILSSLACVYRSIIQTFW